MVDRTRYSMADTGHVSINRANEQRRKFIIEASTIEQNNTVQLDLSDYLDTDELALPNFGIEIFTHNGGLENSAPAATYTNSDGDTITFEFWDPDNANQNSYKALDDGGRTTVVHTLDSVTPANATPAEVAASLNADANFAAWAWADINMASANGVTIFPKGPRGRVRVTAVSAAAGINWAGEARNDQRTFTKSPFIVADWGYTYNASTGVLLITQLNGTAKERVAIVVHTK